MNTNLIDTKLTKQLEAIRSSNPEVYLNLKANVDAVYQKLAIEAMERSFMDQEGSTHAIYQVAPGMEDILSWCFHSSRKDASSKSYLILPPDKSFIALYHLDDNGYISARRHIFGERSVTNILETFEGYFFPITEGLLDEGDSPLVMVPPKREPADLFEGEDDEL